MTSIPDLTAALAESARAMHRPTTLEDTLGAIVHAARASVPGIDAVSISVRHRDGRLETVAGTDELARSLDTTQYELDEGPCVDTLREVQVLYAQHLRHHQEWPRYVRVAVERGVLSQLGLQLSTREEVLGGLNLYSTSRETMHPDAEQMAEPFAAHAALALAGARKVHHLDTAMESRQVIGEAVGIVMERYRIPRDRAFQFLARASQTNNVKLRDVARQMVDQVNDEAAAST